MVKWRKRIGPKDMEKLLAVTIETAKSEDHVYKEHLERAQRIVTRNRNGKNKLYSMQTPEVECIAKGKVHKKYEFGCKVSLVSTSKDSWIVTRILGEPLQPV